MEISIAEAARTLKISRNTIKKRLSNGELSKTPGGKIETSELFRVFGSSPRPSIRTSNRPPLTIEQTIPRPPLDQLTNIHEHPEYKAQAEKIRLLEDALRKAEERELWQRAQLDKMVDVVKLLEVPKENPTKWYKFWNI